MGFPLNHPAIVQAIERGLIADNPPPRTVTTAPTTPEKATGCLAVAFWIPGLVPVSKANRRDHWAAVGRRERGYVTQLDAATRRVTVAEWVFPVTVTFHRVGVRLLDDDNLSGAYKKLRDAAAKLLGVDDGDRERVRWAYTQETAKRGHLGTLITIKEMSE